jgi:CRISPR/Cas system-associated endoribonuclease Cas2
MGLFVVSYDLRKKKDYQTLWDEMDRLGGHKPLLSVYFLNVDVDTASELRDHLSKFIDDDDQLIVVPFSQKPAHQMANKGTNDWIKDNL